MEVLSREVIPFGITIYSGFYWIGEALKLLFCRLPLELSGWNAGQNQGLGLQPNWFVACIGSVPDQEP
jgi:hypothetical protein